MKKIFTIFILIAFMTSLFSQSPPVQWQKTYGGTKNDVAYYLKKTSDDGYVFLGANSSNNGDATEMNGIHDIWVVKINSIGAIQWQKSIGGESYDWAREIKQTSDGGYIIIGSTDSKTGYVTNNHGKSDLWIIKLSNTGSLMWQKTYGGTNDDNGRDIIPTRDGGYTVIGDTNSKDGDLTGVANPYNYNNIWLLKIDSAGNILSQKTYGGTGDDQARKILVTDDNGYIIAGETTSKDGDISHNNGYYDYWVIKINSSGNILWEKTYGGSEQDDLFDIKKTNDGGYILSGFSSSPDGNVTGNHGAGDAWIVKINDIGSIQWQKSLGGSKSDSGNEIIQTKDGGYLLSAWTSSSDGDVSENFGQMDGWLIKLNNAGDTLWQKTLGGAGYDWLQTIFQTEDGFITAGYNGSVGDAWIIKLGQEPLTTLELLKRNVLIYPNPVRSNLNFSLPNGEKISHISIHNIAGQKVLDQAISNATINLEKLQAGTYTLTVTNSAGTSYSSKFIKE